MHAPSCMRVALLVALGALPVHGAPPGTIYEVADPHDFLNRSLERRNFITELLLGYDHYPHWDGDQCIVGTPAQFQGTCKYTPEGGILGRGMKGFLHSAGLKECDGGGDCTCTGCNELNVLLGEGGNFALPEEEISKSSKNHGGVFTSGYHTPSAWVRAINEATRRYEQHLEARKQLEIIKEKQARLQKQILGVKNQMRGKKDDDATAGFAESMSHQLTKTKERLEMKQEQADHAYNTAMRAWRAAMDVKKHRGKTAVKDAPASVRQRLPEWDTSGIRVQGRFQFRTGCMVRRGNDCGCFLVDTEIEEHERSSCTKGEYLSGVEGNVGYGEWDDQRIFQLTFQDLQITASKKVKQVLAGDNPSVFLRGRPSICDDDVVATTGRTICAEERISSTRTAFPVRAENVDPTSEIQGFQPISWRGDSMAVWYIYLPQTNAANGMPHFQYHVEVVGTHDDSRSSWVWKKVTSMWRYLTSTQEPVLYRLDLPLAVLDEQAKNHPGDSVVEKGMVPMKTDQAAKAAAEKAQEKMKTYATETRLNLKDVQWAREKDGEEYEKMFVPAHWAAGADAVAAAAKAAANSKAGKTIKCFFGNCGGGADNTEVLISEMIPTLSWTITGTSEQSTRNSEARVMEEGLREMNGGTVDTYDLLPRACPGSEGENHCSAFACENLDQKTDRFRVSARLAFRNLATGGGSDAQSGDIQPLGTLDTTGKSTGPTLMLPKALYEKSYRGPRHAVDWDMHEYTGTDGIGADLLNAGRKAALVTDAQLYTWKQDYYTADNKYDQTDSPAISIILESLVIEGPLIFLKGKASSKGKTMTMILKVVSITKLDMFSYSPRLGDEGLYYVIRRVQRVDLDTSGGGVELDPTQMKSAAKSEAANLINLMIPASSKLINVPKQKTWQFRPYDMIRDKSELSIVDKAISTWKDCSLDSDGNFAVKDHTGTCRTDAVDEKNKTTAAAIMWTTPNKLWSQVPEFSAWQCTCTPEDPEATRSNFEKQLVNAMKVAQKLYDKEEKASTPNLCSIKVFTVDDDEKPVPKSARFLGKMDCTNGKPPHAVADFCLPWQQHGGETSPDLAAGKDEDAVWTPKTKKGKDLFRYQLVQCVGVEGGWTKCDSDESTRALTAPLTLPVKKEIIFKTPKKGSEVKPIEEDVYLNFNNQPPPTNIKFSLAHLTDTSGLPGRVSLKDAGAYLLPRNGGMEMPLNMVLYKNRNYENAFELAQEAKFERGEIGETDKSSLEPLVDSLASLVDADEQMEQVVAPRKQAGAAAGNTLQPADYDPASLEREREGVSTSFPDLERRRRDEAIMEISREQQDDTLMHGMHALQMRAALLRKEDDRLLRTSTELSIPQLVTGRARERRDLADSSERRMGLLMRGLAACIERHWDVNCLSGDADLEALRDDAYQHRRVEAEWAVAQRTSNGTTDMPGLERADELAELKAALARERPEWEQRQSGAGGEELERWDWPWAKDDAASAKTDPRVSFMGRMRSWFGLETQKEAEEIAFIEAKKVGYAFPHYSESTRECYLGVKPGFLEQCRSQPMRPEVDDQGDTVEGECKSAIDCTCDRFDLKGVSTKTGGAVDSRPFQMPCEEQMTEFFADLVPHASVGRFIDPNRYKWEVGCYIPTRSSWFWKDSKDMSKSKCGCFLVDTLLTAEATEETEGQMCSYAPMEVDSSKVTGAMDGAEQADQYTASSQYKTASNEGEKP